MEKNLQTLDALTDVGIKGINDKDVWESDVNTLIPRIKILKAMSAEVIEHVRYYWSDFLKYDVEKILDADNHNETMYWFLRESGTHLISGTATDEDINLYGSYNDRMYILNLQDGTLDKIWDREIDGKDTLPKKR